MQHVQYHQLLHFCSLVPHVIFTFTQLAVRGGLRLTGNFAYQIEPEVCIKLDIVCKPEKNPDDWREGAIAPIKLGDGACINPSFNVTYCCAAYDSWPDSYVDLYAYYSVRKFKAKWPVSLHSMRRAEQR